ncbi:MAG TPA: class II aldolase/adducin family protein [Stellaceae bacterium]|jgi:ribulose-5-phosphate 4-epimerase/fuculose-1-phosphate aldolase|nr:class II aldolase/adducin family protein [Stellaceae bacterium]
MTSDAIERKLREEVAACTLMLVDLELLGYSGHVSMRLPDRETILIQPLELSRAALKPEDLLVVKIADGKQLTGTMRPPAEVFLHTEIMKARPDINAVAHFHHDRTTSFTLAEGPTLLPIKNHAIRWESGIPVHEDPSHVSSIARGEALARTLGPHHAAQIRAHGQVITAESIPALLIDSVHFVENALAMFDAATLGKIRPLTAQEIELFKGDLKRGLHISKLWTYYVGRARAKGVLPADWSLDIAK